MRKLITLLLAIPSIAIQAQTIKGIVYSVQEKSPVEFSPVALLHLPDSALTTSTSTKTGGAFTFDNVKPGKYFVKATYLGCTPTGKAIEITTDSKTVQLDTIFMKPSSQQLAEVHVNGERITGKELVDRTVYSIPSGIAKTSVNGYEVLRKIPGIQVDFNNNITLNGKSNFIIQVDGKLRDKEYLARLLPTDIESIEVINNPSGKYEGTIDGVINIILKKEARVGMNGNFSGMVRPSDKLTGYGAGSLEYGFGKVSVYASGYSFFQNLNSSSTNYSNFMFKDSTADLTGKGKFHIAASAINVGSDYYINDKNNLSFNFSYKPVSLKNDITSEGPLQGIMSHYFSSPTSSSTKSGEINASLFYQRKYKKPIQELTSEMVFYSFHSNEPNTLDYYYFNPSDTVVNKRWNNNTNDRSSLSAKVDYVYPLGISTKFETGYQFYYQQMKYDFESDSASNNTNVYRYSELRNAAYAGLTWNLGKFGFQTSLRAEYSNILVNKNNSSDYMAWLPSANIQYKITGVQNIKLTYNRRINRPSVYDLNPYRKLTNNFSFTEGNPYLKPEYHDKLQLTYSLNFGKNFISPNIYYDFVSNRIGQKSSIVMSPEAGGSALLTSPDNIITGYERGVGLNANIIFFNINARVYQGHYNKFTYMNEGQAVTIPSQNYSSFSITSYAFSQLFKKKLNGFVFFSYNGVNVNAQSKTYSTPMYGIGAQRIAGNHTFGVFYFLPFKKDFVPSKTITETPLLYSKTTMSFDVSYYIQVMYSYKFNKGKAIKKVNHKADTESDSKSGGVGQ
ncbi:MAG TPA: TonB-dependent receptor [Bacteroidales bacterium]